MRYVVILLFCVVSGPILSQSDSVAWSADSPWPDAVYISYNALRKSKPVFEDRIISEVDRSDAHFLTKTLAKKDFVFMRKGEQVSLASSEVWGYMENNSMYINVGGVFCKVPAFGAIIYFGSFHKTGEWQAAEDASGRKEYLLDYYSGNIDFFSMEAVEKLLQRDEALHAEFMALNRLKRREQVYLFIRRFNLAHPVYLVRQA